MLEFGDVDLVELRALIERSALFIGGDSGPCTCLNDEDTGCRHLRADALGAVRAMAESDVPTESVEIDGLPCRPCDQRTCAPGDFRCLTRIEPQAVLAAAERAIAQAHIEVRTHA